MSVCRQVVCSKVWGLSDRECSRPIGQDSDRAISRLWTSDNIGLMHQFLTPSSGLTNPDKLFFNIHMIILTKIQFNFRKKYSLCLTLDVLLMPIFYNLVFTRL